MYKILTDMQNKRRNWTRQKRPKTNKQTTINTKSSINHVIQQNSKGGKTNLWCKATKVVS